MTSQQENITWQSYNGRWNCGFYRWVGQDEDGNDEWSENEFEWLATGFRSAQEAQRCWPGSNPGSWPTLPFSPLSRGQNDELDLDARNFGSPSIGDRVLPDRDVIDRRELAVAEQAVKDCQEAINRIRFDNRRTGLDEAARRQVSRHMRDQREAESRAEFLRPRVEYAATRNPDGPFYTPEALRRFREQVEAWPDGSQYERGVRDEALTFYAELARKAEGAGAGRPSTSPRTAAGGLQARQPRGVPVGGQFATRARGENADLA